MGRRAARAIASSSWRVKPSNSRTRRAANARGVLCVPDLFDDAAAQLGEVAQHVGLGVAQIGALDGGDLGGARLLERGLGGAQLRFELGAVVVPVAGADRALLVVAADP